MRRLSQALVLLVMGICAAGAAALLLLAVQYHRFSSDVQASDASLPETVEAALPPSASTLDRPQVTLIRGSGKLASGGIVLFRTVPDGGATAFLSIPPSARLGGVRVSGQDIPQLVGAFRRSAGIRVDHVAVINLANVSRLVDSIGGIDLVNPSRVQIYLSPTRFWSFRAGRLHLNGPHTAAYLNQGVPGSETRDQAERRVLRAIFGHALEPSSVSQLEATGAAVAHAAVTDLTDADVLGLVFTRLDSRRLVQCSTNENDPLESAAARRVVTAFLARNGAVRAPGCHTQPLHPTSYLPPKAVIVIVQHYGVWVFVATAAAAMLMAIAMAVTFLRLRVRGTPAPAESNPSPAAEPAAAEMDEPTPAAVAAPVPMPDPLPAATAAVGSTPAATAVGPLPQAGWAGAGARLRAAALAVLSGPRRAAAFVAHRAPRPRMASLRPRLPHPHWGPGLPALAERQPIPGGRYRMRVRRFLYTHQDAVWIGVCAAIVTVIVIVLASA